MFLKDIIHVALQLYSRTRLGLRCQLILGYTGSSSGLQLLYLAEPKAYLAGPTLPFYFKVLQLVGSTMPVYFRADSRCTSPGQQFLFFTQSMMPVHCRIYGRCTWPGLRSSYVAGSTFGVPCRVYGACLF